MDTTLQKRFDSRPLAMLVGLAVLGCCLLAGLAFADVSSAAPPKPPETGLNCVEGEGKISGRGSTYQNNLQEEMAKFYRDDFCGKTGTETAEDKVGGSGRGEAGSTMLAYNYPSAEKNKGTGSGAGLKATSCRTDAFAGTDLPYSVEQLEQLDGKPGLLVEKEGTTCAAGINGKFTPPFAPNAPEEWPDTQSGKEDTTAPVMSFPVGGSSVALPINLTAATCGGKAENVPTSLEFTAKEVSRIFGGDVSNWNDAELVKTNPSLASCTAAVTRVVRSDNSGTTNIFKSYLVRAENERTAQKCAEGKHWSSSASSVSGTGEYFESPNTKWPGKQSVGKEGTCSAIVAPTNTGGPALIEEVKKIEGSVGYADLSNATGTEGAGLLLPNVENATETSAEAPNEGSAANCTYKVLGLPRGGAEGAVGLTAKDTWANNNESTGNPNHENATDLGGLYPICGLTFDLVYTGLESTKGGANPISRLTPDQRRTLYSYMTYLLSSIGQEKLNSISYASLPPAWLPLLRAGFQGRF
jgi:ABC-type phosphate transport system substrate-binding protein